MIINKSRRLEAVLAGAADPAPEVAVDYFDWTDQADANGNPIRTAPNRYEVALNGTTDVVILAAPLRNPVSEVEKLTVFNKDNATIVVTIKTDIAAGGGTEYIEVQQTVLTLKTLCWEKNTGWYQV